MAKSAKENLLSRAEPRCQRVAEKLQVELVDVEQVKDAYGVTLRVTIDRPEGMDLDGCERYHKALIPLVEDLDYDFLEVSSPGIDRPLKRDKDFERALGSEVEIHFYRAMDGARESRGILADWDEKTVTLEQGETRRTWERKDCALIRPVVDMTGVEEVDLGEESPE